LNAADLHNFNLAIKLARSGLPVFPCLEADGLAMDQSGKPKGAKAPYSPAGFKDASTDEHRIQEWWAQWPNAVPGLPTGAASGISVIDGDIDRETGEAVGETQITALHLDHPAAVHVRTQSGGVQILYRHIEGARTKSKQAASNIDTRGDGGYIIAPGARMQNGACYQYTSRTLSAALAAGDLPSFPLTAVEAAEAARAAAKRGAAAGKIDTGFDFGRTEATGTETMEVVRRLLAEAPNDLGREDWVKLAVSLRVSFGQSLRNSFTEFSLRYVGAKPCTAEDADQVWHSSGTPHTVSGIAPALALLRCAVGPERFRAMFAEVFAETRNGANWTHGAGEASEGPQDARTTPPDGEEGPSGGEGGNTASGNNSAGPRGPLAFKLVHVSDMRFSEPEFLVDDLLETSALALAFGDPGCGKSFVAIDLACCIATGHEFHGREVRQGAVIYLAGEGHNGLKRRAVAWGKHAGRNPDDGPLYFSEVPARLLDAAHANAVAAAVDSIAASKGNPALIVVDTLARSFAGGDENATKDMNDFIASVDVMKARYPGCVVLIVHHTGHSDKQRARGSLALKGALDAEYRVEKVDGTIALICTKMKDAPEPPPMGFALTGVDLGMTDRKGRPVTSAVLVESEAPTKRAPRLTGQALIAMQAFSDALKDHGVKKGGEDFPVNRQCVALTDWKAACDRHALSSGEAESSKRAAFHKAWKGLQERGVIRVLDGYAWRVEE